MVGKSKQKGIGTTLAVVVSMSDRIIRWISDLAGIFVDLPEVVRVVRDWFTGMSGTVWFEIVRWTMLAAIIVAIWMPWGRSSRKRKEEPFNDADASKSKGRTVLEKYRAREGWRKQIDDLIAQGEEARTRDEREHWQSKVFDSFDNYLVDPGKFKGEFRERTKEIRGRGRNANRAVQRGIAYLKSKRDSLAEHELD